MKIEKAIEILELDLRDPIMLDTQDLVEAQKLGIQALKAFRKIRTGEGCATWELLPGESEE